MTEHKTKTFLGITVLADFIVNEGIEAVLDSVTERTGATAIALNPTVTGPAPEGQGSFQPPTDAGSSPRLFDRPLWGHHSLWVHSSPSFQPDASLYDDTSYPPRHTNELTEKHGQLVADFIEAALNRDLLVFFQLGATQPTGLRDDDKPWLPNGQQLRKRLANTGSLASADVSAYNRAYLRDLLQAYPNISGFRPDWPEYPCYTLDEVFQDFSPHVAHWAAAHGFDFATIRHDVGSFYDYLHGSLRNEDLEDFGSADRGKTSQITLLCRYPAVLEWLRLKTALSTDLLRNWRATLNEFGGTEKLLSANAFMPPFNLLTGFDFTNAAKHCQAISPKLYTMHWSVIVEFWARTLLKYNPKLDEKLLVRSLAHLLDLGDSISPDGIADYGYPKPHEAHPIPDQPQRRKIVQVQTLTAKNAQITPLVHGYGPLHDFVRRFQIVAGSTANGVWINRYGYLSDAKLDAVGQIWRQR